MKQADHIIAISECTKRDILEFGDYNPDKISVIYQSCNPRFSELPSRQEIESTSEKYKLPKRYILSVGTIEERVRESLKYVQKFKGTDVASQVFGVYNK